MCERLNINFRTKRIKKTSNPFIEIGEASPSLKQINNNSKHWYTYVLDCKFEDNMYFSLANAQRGGEHKTRHKLKKNGNALEDVH